jgi:hypothetical protein
MEQAVYMITETVLRTLWIIPLVILWRISLCLARRKHDHARSGIVLAKVGFALWIL